MLWSAPLLPLPPAGLVAAGGAAPLWVSAGGSGLMLVLPGVILLGLVIFVHELGHFLAAKGRGVRVLRFSLGFGRPLVGMRHGGTEYCIAWFPIGGYVQMAGDSPGEDGSMPSGREEFLSHPWPGRLLIAVAGPAMNLVTAFLVMVIVGLTGVSYPDFPNRLGATPDSSMAFRAGLREGDRIVTVNGAPVRTWVEIFVRSSRQPKRHALELGVERGGRTLAVRVSPGDREPVLSSLRRTPDPPVVGGVVTGMPAYMAGIQEGDSILAVNGKTIATWDELPPALRGEVDRPVRLRISRQGRVFEVVLSPIDPEGRRGGQNGRIGIEAPRYGVYVERHGVIESLDLGFRATGSLVASVYGGLWLTFTRPLYYREQLGGPLFIAQAAGEQARRGLDSYLQFLALINVAIMAFNLLPLPVLDGGHILLALLQGLRRRALSAKAYLRFQRVGLLVIGTIFLLILVNDPLRLLKRQRALDTTRQETRVAPSPP